MQSPADDQVQMDHAVMCGDIFENVHSSYGVSTDNIISSSLVAEIVTHDLLPQNHPKTLSHDIEKSAPNFRAPNSMLSSENVTDNQTQTMDLLSDLENILSSNLPGQTLDNRSLLSDTNTGPDTQLPSGPTQNPAIDFDSSVLTPAKENIIWNGTERRVVGIDSFGLSGANAHIVVENYIDNKKLDSTNNDFHTFIKLSAKTDTA